MTDEEPAVPGKRSGTTRRCRLRQCLSARAGCCTKLPGRRTPGRPSNRSRRTKWPLANDDPAQILTGPALRLFWVASHPAASRPASPPGGEAAGTASGEGGVGWKLVIETAMIVTDAVVPVWAGVIRPAAAPAKPVGTPLPR